MENPPGQRPTFSSHARDTTYVFAPLPQVGLALAFLRFPLQNLYYEPHDLFDLPLQSKLKDRFGEKRTFRLAPFDKYRDGVAAYTGRQVRPRDSNSVRCAS